MAGQLLISALVAGSQYALIALGLNLVYGTMRLLNVAHGEIVMVGAYAAACLFSWFRVGPLVSGVFIAALGWALGVLVYRGAFRRLLRSREVMSRVESNSLLLFFGLSVILQSTASLLFTANSRGYPYLVQVFHFGGISITANRFASLVIATSVSLGLILYLRFHRMGRWLRALIEHRDAAALVGIDIERVQQVSLCIGFAAAALAGALVSMRQPIDPFFGFPFTISAFVVVILGGLGNLAASVLAGFMLGVVEVFGTAFTSASYRSLILYSVFVLTLLVFPGGLFGAKGRLR